MKRRSLPGCIRKYLLAIVGLTGLYEVVSNIVDFQFSATIAGLVVGDLNKDSYFGYVGHVTSISSLLGQLLLTSFIMKRYGISNMRWLSLLSLLFWILFIRYTGRGIKERASSKEIGVR